MKLMDVIYCVKMVVIKFGVFQNDDSWLNDVGMSC